uniref:Putative terminase n=1 Tax=viral metagenome TaxID=1070528 RepID=A0A6M3JRE5_9ZZZZ
MQTERKALDVILSSTQQAFVMSEKVVPVLVGSMGEGKSFAGVAALIAHAKRNAAPIRAAIIRDTHVNIKNSTRLTIEEFFQPIHSLKRPAYKFRNDYKELSIFCDPRVDVDLFGIDDDASLSKLQGPEYALIWLEEPAPIADKKNAGLSEAVFNASLVRAMRQRDRKGRLQVTMNPADEDHWTYRRLIEDPDVNPDTPLITKEVFNIPYGENQNLAAIAREATQSAYKNDPSAYARYVKGQFASVYHGMKVTPEFKAERHMCQNLVVPAPGLIGFRFFDGWHSPCVLMGQITQLGRLIVMETIFLENSDIIHLVDMIKSVMETPKWKDKCKGWRDIGDITMRIPDQSNKQKSAAKVIENAFNTVFEPGPSTWDHMKLGLKHALRESAPNGEPMIYLSNSQTFLKRALDGGWHYPVDNSGNISSKIPQKNIFSHVGDCFANGCNVLIPIMSGPPVDDRKIKAIKERMKQRINSYGSVRSTYG